MMMPVPELRSFSVVAQKVPYVSLFVRVNSTLSGLRMASLIPSMSIYLSSNKSIISDCLHVPLIPLTFNVLMVTGVFM